MSKGLCLYAFEVLNHQLTKDPITPLPKILKSIGESFDDFPPKAPLFVTWDKDDILRGCIGTFAPQPIEMGIRKFSISASMQDPRFPKITIDELPHLSCDVTLLSNFKAIKDPSKWEIGRHGLRLSFEKDGQYYSGTFLPSVAKEQEWDHLNTLWYLVRKANYSVSKASTLEFYTSGIKQGWLSLETYEGMKFSIDYEEYRDWLELIQETDF